MTFNPKYHAVIKGWDALNRYCEKRWKETPSFMEHFAHMAEVDFQKIEAREPGNEYWTAYFLLALRDEYGHSTMIYDGSVYDGICNGTIKPMKV